MTDVLQLQLNELTPRSSSGELSGPDSMRSAASPGRSVFRRALDLDRVIELCALKLRQEPTDTRCLLQRALAYFKKGE